MDKRFMEALGKLKKADPSLTIQALFEIFSSIGKMDVGDVVAGIQALDLFRATAGTLDEASEKAVKAFEQALITRASALYMSMDLDKDFYFITNTFRGAFGEERFEDVKC